MESEKNVMQAATAKRRASAESHQLSQFNERQLEERVEDDEDDSLIDEYLPSESHSDSSYEEADDSSDEDFGKGRKVPASQSSHHSSKKQKREVPSAASADAVSIALSQVSSSKFKGAAAKKNKTAIAKIVKYCSEKEAKQLLLDLAASSEEANAIIVAFQPERMPIAVPKDDYWAQHCIFCESKTDLDTFQDMKICRTCDDKINGKGEIELPVQ